MNRSLHDELEARKEGLWMATLRFLLHDEKETNLLADVAYNLEDLEWSDEEWERVYSEIKRLLQKQLDRKRLLKETSKGE